MRLERIFTDPLILFLLVGGLVFWAYDLIESDRQPIIEVSEDTRARIIEEQSLLLGRPLSQAEQDALIANFINREVLFQEALAEGMHLIDPRTREALIERQRLKIVGYQPPPDDAALVDFYSDNLDLYQSEQEISSDLLVLTDRPVDPRALLAALGAGDPPPLDASTIIEERSIVAYGVSALRAMLGQATLNALLTADANQWIGPMETPVGWVFLRKTDDNPSRLLPFVDVRDQVRLDYLTRKDQQRLEEAMTQLRERYDIQLAP